MVPEVTQVTMGFNTWSLRLDELEYPYLRKPPNGY